MHRCRSICDTSALTAVASTPYVRTTCTRQATRTKRLPFSRTSAQNSGDAKALLNAALAPPSMAEHRLLFAYQCYSNKFVLMFAHRSISVTAAC